MGIVRAWYPLALFAALAMSCGGDGDTEPAVTDAGTKPDVPAANDGSSDGPSYPAGPYGVVTGETIADLGFYDPETEGQVQLAQWYQHPKTRLLMVISTAAW